MDSDSYLHSTVGVVLSQCLTELVYKMPQDPIEWIAHWLYRYMDNELYLREKSVFNKKMHRAHLEFQKGLVTRQRRINYLESKIGETSKEMKEGDNASKCFISTAGGRFPKSMEGGIDMDKLSSLFERSPRSLKDRQSRSSGTRSSSSKRTGSTGKRRSSRKHRRSTGKRSSSSYRSSSDRADARRKRAATAAGVRPIGIYGHCTPRDEENYPYVSQTPRGDPSNIYGYQTPRGDPSNIYGSRTPNYIMSRGQTPHLGDSMSPCVALSQADNVPGWIDENSPGVVGIDDKTGVPVGMGYWCLDCNLGLVCGHTILGDLAPRGPLILPETPEMWESREFIPQHLYDHEVYSYAPANAY